MNGAHTAYGRENGSNTMVYMVHGILGSPAQFRFLADSLPESVDYRCALLPGHGGTMRAFRCMRAESWLDFIHETAAELRARYDRLIYVGHSMGCLLAVRAALADPCGLRALFLLAPPLFIDFRLRALRAPIRVGLDCIPEDDEEAHWARAACSIEPNRFLPVYLGWISKYAALFALSRSTRKSVSRLAVPTTALFSARERLLSCLLAQAETLAESTHLHYPPDDLVQVQDCFLGVLRAAGFC